MQYTFDDLWRMAEAAQRSSLLPSGIKNADAAFFVMATGVELGLQPMMSLRQLTIVKGKVTLSAEAMLALAMRAGVSVQWEVLTTTEATVILSRDGSPPHRETFTMEDARRAGLAGGNTWRAYPKAMLRSRCISAACKAYCPDIVSGLYTPEEMESVQEPRQLEQHADVRQLPQKSWGETQLARLCVSVGQDIDPHHAQLYVGLPIAKWSEKNAKAALLELRDAARRGTIAAIVPSETTEGVRYILTGHPSTGMACTCESYRFHNEPGEPKTCKHIEAFVAYTTAEKVPA
jgi:hypothetical protein